VITLFEAAARDIEDVLEQSLADCGQLPAEKYYEPLKRCVELLSENPGMGTGAENVRAGYRRFPHESHVVFYRASPQGILVVRVLHKRMGLGQHI
jgi:toxin ParE1/3/4